MVTLLCFASSLDAAASVVASIMEKLDVESASVECVPGCGLVVPRMTSCSASFATAGMQNMLRWGCGSFL
jgi:hypothetical protein